MKKLFPCFQRSVVGHFPPATRYSENRDLRELFHTIDLLCLLRTLHLVLYNGYEMTSSVPTLVNKYMQQMTSDESQSWQTGTDSSRT